MRAPLGVLQADGQRAVAAHGVPGDRPLAGHRQVGLHEGGQLSDHEVVPPRGSSWDRCIYIINISYIVLYIYQISYITKKNIMYIYIQFI